MKKENDSSNKEQKTLQETLQDIKYSLNHLEDIEADNRAIIIKLCKQNNTIVEYLKSLEIEIVEGAQYPSEFENEEFNNPLMNEQDRKKSLKTEQLREMLDTFLEKKKDLKEFEKELKKHKDKLTPGQIGEA